MSLIDRIAGQDHRLSRRDLLRLSLANAVGLSVAGWMSKSAGAATLNNTPHRACILLWMSGGPSQTDTFDMKPGHKNGGPFKPIQTSIPGIQICEHLPQLAKVMDHLALIRSMKTKEGDHGRAAYVLRTGYEAQGAVQYPTMGSFISKQLADPDDILPGYVSISPFRLLNPAAYGPGFLGPTHAPLVVGEQASLSGGQFNDSALRVKNLDMPRGMALSTAESRLRMLYQLEDDFAASHPAAALNSHRTAYAQAVKMIRSRAAGAFDIEKEPSKLRDAYGKNLFGQSCLLARRLVERGVPFVEVALNGVNGGGLGWDTHVNNFDTVKRLCGVMDPAWATLIRDLKQRGLLESTLIVWMGEFGRTPQINNGSGRDHFPNAWSTVLGGGCIRGGQVVGKTSKDGAEVVDRPVSPSDLIATICTVLGLDPYYQNMSNVGRPIRLADPSATLIKEVLL